MLRLQRSVLALLRIVLVLFATTLSHAASAEDARAKPVSDSPNTNVTTTDTAPGSSSSVGKDDSGDDDDDDDDGEEQQ